MSSDAAIAIPLDAADPIDSLARFSSWPRARLLQSAAPGHPLSRFSFLSADPVAMISCMAGAWPSASAQVRRTIRTADIPFPNLPPFQGGWIGWFGYELGTAFDRVARHESPPLSIPDVALTLHDWVIAWDHDSAHTWLISTGCDASGMPNRLRARRRADEVLRRWDAPDVAAPTSARKSQCEPVGRDFTADSYQRAVAAAIEHVRAGDVFQVNLSQRFHLPFGGDPLGLYRELHRRTPAPMAAFLEHDGIAVISASPERFLRLDPRTRQVETRPIKGTRPRGADQADDHRLAQELLASEKDLAENVMIVDLQRNDLARVCERGSVRVPSLNALETHPTVHHLVSTVTARLHPDRDALDLLAATFPGGSITGAPKLRAMEIIRDLEPFARGVYSGSIGWIGLDGGMDTSIAIRTVTVSEGQATFHAGGGITAESEPAAEYRESMDKARALIDAVSGS